MSKPATSETNIGAIVRSIRELWEGRRNAQGNFTLTASATSTVVTAPNCGPSSEITISAKTLNAAGAVATTYVSAVTTGAFTVTHVSAVSTDRTFSYAIHG